MDQTPSRLSEISHLFLSDVRQKQTGASARPQRTPPAIAPITGPHPAGAFRRDASVDVSPEEFEDMLRPAALRESLTADAAETPAEAQAVGFKPARVVIAHHLGETMADHVRDLAAALGRRVGLVYADSGNVRVCCVDAAGRDSAEDPAPEALDGSQLREVLVELDQDVSEWLIVLPDPKSNDAQALLAAVPKWTLLVGTDHDGIVGAYRTLKSVCGDRKPAVTVCVFDADTDAERAKTFAKLSGVCEQFLKLPVTQGPAVHAVEAAEHCLLDAAAAEDEKYPDAPHWPVLATLAGTASAEAPRAAVAKTPAAPARVMRSIPVRLHTPVERPAAPVTAAPPATPVVSPAKPVLPAMPPAKPANAAPASADDAFESILDLPEADASPAAILRAVVRNGDDWTESPVKAPALPGATVAIDRDRRLVLLVVARPGLSDLKAVGTAYRWLHENRSLVALATPQCAVDADSAPKLHLLVDPADVSADALQPLRIGGGVSVAAYRKLRWNGRTGLMLEAA